MGCYLLKLVEFLDIFEVLYCNFTPDRRTSALLQLSDLLQRQVDEETAEDFFVDPISFLSQDYGPLEEFIGEKRSIIMKFVNMALNRRMRELGIYNVGSDPNQAADPPNDEQASIMADLAAISWFLTGDLHPRLETYFDTIPDSGLCMQITEDSAELTEEEILNLDNESRPEK